MRPHHGLCVTFFRGEGYSPAFVENMKEIIESLEKNPQIILRCASDKFCRPCPHRRGEHNCASEEKVLRYDRKVLDLCQLSEGSVLSWTDFSRKVHENILIKNLRTDVCGDCQWTELCK